MSAQAELRPPRPCGTPTSLLVGAIAMGLAVLVSAGHARADGAAVVPPAHDTAATNTAARFGYGFAIGYGTGIAPRSKQKGRDVADVQTLAIQPVLVDLIVRQRARSAADAAALAGVIAGRSASAELASANGATLVTWTRDGAEVTVVVDVAGHRARARATDAP